VLADLVVQSLSQLSITACTSIDLFSLPYELTREICEISVFQGMEVDNTMYSKNQRPGMLANGKLEHSMQSSFELFLYQVADVGVTITESDNDAFRSFDLPSQALKGIWER
jgi:hypothetical protein